MKQCLVVKAFTGSEWDNVNFAVVELSKERVSFINQMMKEVARLKEIYQFGGQLEVFCDNAEFFAGVNDNCPFDFADDEAQEGKPVIMELPDDYEDHFYRPESALKYGHMSITEDTVQFVTTGKHTGEEFYTETIDLNAAIEAEKSITIF